MRIKGIEAPMLRLPAVRCEIDHWLKRWEFDLVTEGPHDWHEDIGCGQKNCFKRGILVKWALTGLEKPDERKLLIREGLECLKPGGVLVTIDRACDNGKELAEHCVRAGTPAPALCIGNLSNRDIAVLRPDNAVFLTGFLHKKKDRVKSEEFTLQETEDLFYEVFQTFPDQALRKPIPTPFTVNLLTVGMIWTKK